MTPEEKELSLTAPQLPLSFLLELHPRETNRRQMPGCKDSAIFFRLWDLFDCLREPSVINELTPEQRAAADAFHDAMNRLPWRALPEYPHVSELPDDDLTPLIEPGKRLFSALSGKHIA